MRKKLIGLLVAMLLLTVGCVQQPPAYAPPVQEPPVSEPDVTEEMPAEEAPVNSTLEEPVAVEEPPVEEPATEEPTPVPVLAGEPPADMTWISPGKVMIGNFFPGARAEWPLLIHNGKDEVATFSVLYRKPSRLAEGYVEAPPIAQTWIIIVDTTPVLMPKETKEVLIAVDMPEDAVSPGPKWEFWIGVKDITTTGMIATELCSRWMISMAVQ